MNKLFKRFTAMVLAVACVGAIGATAAAEDVCKPPVNWKALYIKGAPSSVNKDYTYTMWTYGGDFDLSCTQFTGDFDRRVNVWKQYSRQVSGKTYTYKTKITEMYAETQSPILVENPNNTSDGKVTFVFYASSPERFATCQAYGVITHHQG